MIEILLATLTLGALLIVIFSGYNRVARMAKLADRRYEMQSEFARYLAAAMAPPPELSPLILGEWYTGVHLMAKRFIADYPMYAGDMASTSTVFIKDYRADIDQARQQLIKEIIPPVGS